MFDHMDAADPGHPVPGTGVPVDASVVAGWTNSLATAAEAADDDAARVDLLTQLETLKRVIEATQADVAVDFDASMRAKAAAQGVGPRRQGRGIDTQIGLARKTSPHRAKQHLGMAKVLRGEMPHTLAAFRAGALNEYAAQLIVQATACVDLEVRQQIDAELCGDPAEVVARSPKELGQQARKRAAELDNLAVATARAKAETDRRVTVRPAPDTMAYLTAHLPVAQAVAVYAALTRAADSFKAEGDERSRSQIMADLLVERVTGQGSAAGVPVAINLVVSAATLLAGGNQAAHLDGYGPIPAELARALVANALDPEVGAWLRKVYAGPHGGLVAMDSRARIVPAGLAVLLGIRDGGVCRTPWCDAPIRHRDHVEAVEDGGTTSEPNLQGLCEACNHAKQAPGWSAVGDHPPGKRHRVVTTTPTGHDYTSTAPPLPGDHREHGPTVITMTIHYGTRLDYVPVA